MKTKILIADDHALIRRGISALLRNHDREIEIFEAENGIQAIIKAGQILPDIILMDHHMPKLDGVKAAEAIRKDFPSVKMILVSMDMSEEVISNALEAGMSGIVPKDSSENELMNAIRDVSNGKVHLHTSILNIAKNKKNRKKGLTAFHGKILTTREMEILQLIMQGNTSVKISKILGISERTVEHHRHSIMKKSHTQTVAELIKFAIKHNFSSN